VISLTDIFDAASRRRNDVIMLPAICRVSGNDLWSSRTVHWHTVPCTSNSWTAASRNAKLSRVQPVASRQPRLRITSSGLSCSAMSTRQIHSVDELKQQLIDRCLVRYWTVVFWRGYWPVVRRHWAYVHAKRRYFEYSLWTDNADFVHICYIQCDLFDRYIFNYEIMPATLASTFLFILQGSALADLRNGGTF